MSLDEYRNNGYMKIKRLGDMFIHGYNHDFEYDEGYGDYIAVHPDCSDAIRIVYISMCDEEILGYSERRSIEMAVCWQNPDEPATRQEVIGPFFEIRKLRILGIDDIESLVEYLNQFSVKDIIKENVIGIFHALEDGYITNHQLIYYSDETKELWPEGHDYYRYIYKLDLSKSPELKGIRTKERVQRSYIRHHMAGKELVEELDHDIVAPAGYSKEGNWVYYEKRISTDKCIFVTRNVITGKVFEYNGNVIATANNKAVFLWDNILYKVEGNNLKEIYTLDKFQYVRQRSLYTMGHEKILISPVLRGIFVPCLINFEGDSLGDDTTEGEYIWYSIISLANVLENNEDVDYYEFCHNRDHGFYSKHEELLIEKCTVNNIVKFVENIAETDSKLADALDPVYKIVQMIGTVIDKEEDISDLLMSIRNDYIDSTIDFWNNLVNSAYELNEDIDESKDEIVDRDLLEKRVYDDFVIGYQQYSFISSEYVNTIKEKYADMNKMQDYIGTVWFKNRCMGFSDIDPWHRSVYEELMGARINER